MQAEILNKESGETEQVGGIIQVMPLSLANKIAAGEVVQRPASAVKELVENALDAGAHSIEVVLQGAGSTLIQVVDDGCGMNAGDALLCFERHATSKIRCIEDLEAIHTLGFRGEALASIASVSQVELRTGTDSENPGRLLRINGGELVESSPTAPVRGTSISIKNLFYNVPARRNFLKRPQTELKHILDTIGVMALSHVDVSFRLQHDGNELLSVHAEEKTSYDSMLESRVSSLLPVRDPKSLISVDESTSYLSVRGLLGSPDSARRRRGQQFLFVNGRYVKHRYVEHAALSAYEYLLPEGAHPLFVLFLDIDPRHVDVNVHPTKAEVKFDDERGVYGMLRAVVGKTLGMKFNTPDIGGARPVTGLNLNLPPERDASDGADRHATALESGETPPGLRAPADSQSTSAGGSFARRLPFDNMLGQVSEASRTLYGSTDIGAPLPAGSANGKERSEAGGIGEEGLLWQLHDTYILTQILSGLVIIDQQMAHERILYEQAGACLADGFGLSQQLLFPRTIEFSASDFALLEDLMPDLKRLGFDAEAFGGNSVIVRGVPADISTGDEHSVLDEIVDQYRLFERVDNLSGRENLARSVARRGAVRAGEKMKPKEMRALIDQLFQCTSPYVSPDGRPTMITVSGNELRDRFDRK